MLEFVERLTLAPWDVGARERAALEASGWHPLEAIQIVLGCAHFNYLNRMADGLGITFEYATQIERFEKGGGEARRSELRAAAPPPRDQTRGAVAVERADPAGDAQGSDRELSAALGFHPELSRGVRAWRAFHLRGTELLDAAERARIALFAAAVEWCESARIDATAAAASAGVSAAERATLGSGELAPETPSLRRRLLEHARKLLSSPASLRESDVVELRNHGLDDREIVRLTMLVSYLSFEHRARFGLRGLAS